MFRLNRLGFTIIELLTVISIILVLGALLFPVLHRVKERARAASCLSNLKQIGLAMNQYVDDWGGWYPLHWDDSYGTFTAETEGIRGYWHNGLRPYGVRDAVLICPSARTSAELRIDDGKGTPEERLEKRGLGAGSYGYNYWYLGGWPSAMLHEAALTEPERTICIADISRKLSSAQIYPPPAAIGGLAGDWQSLSEDRRQLYWQNVGARHSEGLNAVHCDGSARHYKIEALERNPAPFYAAR